jgi:hypothetical protein
MEKTVIRNQTCCQWVRSSSGSACPPSPNPSIYVTKQVIQRRSTLPPGSCLFHFLRFFFEKGHGKSIAMAKNLLERDTYKHWKGKGKTTLG